MSIHKTESMVYVCINEDLEKFIQELSPNTPT